MQVLAGSAGKVPAYGDGGQNPDGWKHYLCSCCFRINGVSRHLLQIACPDGRVNRPVGQAIFCRERWMDWAIYGRA